jgi:hypothetical protein
MTTSVHQDSVRQLELAEAGKTDLERDALVYVQGFAWCRRVRAIYEGLQEPGIIGIFLVQIDPARVGVDEWLWLVVGDVPPAYLVTDDAPTPAAALDTYIVLMDSWVSAVREGRSVDDLIPVNAPPTTEYADMLASRLRILRKTVLGELLAPAAEKDEQAPPRRGSSFVESHRRARRP